MNINDKKVFHSFISTVSILLVALLVALVAFLTLATSNILTDNPLAKNGDDYIDLLDGWKYTDTGDPVRAFRHQTAAIVELDASGQRAITYTIDRSVPESFQLFFRADCRLVRMYINGDLLYISSPPANATLEKDMFRGFFIEIPALEPGDVIRLELVDENTSLVYFHLPSFGDDASIRSHVFRTNIDVFITSMFAVLTMLVGLFVYFFHLLHGDNHPDLLYIVLFAAISLLWIYTDSGFALLLFRYNIILYFVNYSSPLLLVVTYLLFLQTAIGQKLTGFAGLCIACIITMLVSYILHFSGVATLRQLMPVSCAVMLFSTLFSTGMIIYKFKHSHLHFKISSGLMTAVTVLSISFYIVFKKVQSTMLFRYALVIFALDMLVVLTLGIHRLEAKAKQSAALQRQKEEAESRMLLSQINSHFFYNTVNTIRGLILSDPDAAYKMTGDFGKYVRYRVNSGADTGRFTSFHEELRAIRAYADICIIRMNHKVNVVYDIDSDDFLIPTLTVEPFVENAITHGIFNGTGEGTVTVSARTHGRCHIVTVIDNGCGFDVSALSRSDGVGIANIRTRLAQYKGCRLTVESEPGKGTVVTVVYPEEYEGTEYETDIG